MLTFSSVSLNRHQPCLRTSWVDIACSKMFAPGAVAPSWTVISMFPCPHISAQSRTQMAAFNWHINSDCCSFRLISGFELVNEMWQGIPFQITIQDSNFTFARLVMNASPIEWLLTKLSPTSQRKPGLRCNCVLQFGESEDMSLCLLCRIGPIKHRKRR